MRTILGHPRYASWIAFVVLALVALYAGEDPRKALRLFAAAPPQANSRPDSGLCGAGVLAPLVPPPPVLTGSLAKELPRFDADET